MSNFCVEEFDWPQPKRTPLGLLRVDTVSQKNNKQTSNSCSCKGWAKIILDPVD